jgi:hypothetical protein
MDIIMLLVLLALIGLLAWALSTYVPMPAGMARLIQIAAIVIGVLILLQALGLLPSLGRVPTLR